MKRITNGVSIDHIDAEKGIVVYNAIHPPKGVTAVIAINVESTRYDIKDVLNIEDPRVRLDIGDPRAKAADIMAYKSKLDLIQLFSPRATINEIKDGQVVVKREPVLPKEINFGECQNPTCISTDEKEPVQPIFYTKQTPKGSKVVCHYCNTYQDPVKLVSEIEGRIGKV